MRAVFLQSPAAALATAVCVSVPAVAPHATEAAAPQIERASVALAASASNLSEALTETLTKLKLVLSPNESGSALELLALPENIANQVQSGGIDSVPSTFIEAGRTASANLMSNLNASTSALASPLDIFAPYNALINFLLGPSTGTFTSVYGLIQSVGNFLGLPISIGGLLLGGGSAQVPGLITKFTQAAQTAIQNFPASIAATIQAIFGGFGAVSTLNAAAPTTLAATPAAAAAASPLDIFGPYNAIINFLVGPSTKTFTSIYGLIAGVGNYLGLPLSIGGLLLGGGSAQVPALITKFTQAAQTALANFPASIAATIQAVFGGFGAVSTLKATGTPSFKATSLDAAPSAEDTKGAEKGDPAGTTTDTKGGSTEGTGTTGTDTTGTDTKGTGTETTGTDTAGTGATGTETTGTDTKGTDTKGTDTKGTGTETAGTGTTGTGTTGATGSGTTGTGTTGATGSGTTSTGTTGATGSGTDTKGTTGTTGTGSTETKGHKATTGSGESKETTKKSGHGAK